MAEASRGGRLGARQRGCSGEKGGCVEITPNTAPTRSAQKQIFNVMKFDSYPRFLRSGVHAECARADLRGLPPPYAPPDAKLKKSASNASERRRSGSLLPWKARAASRDRSAASTQEDTGLTDVVKSSQTGNGSCSLCRVVLPDGATSVVGVDDAVTVKRLVDRLLQRRNLPCSSYDVLVRATPVDCEAPSSALGGREARVERRVVLRVLIGNRAVLVRCRPARRLRHILRPVLQRYLPGSGNHAAVLAGAPQHPSTTLSPGMQLHPDTLVQDLDGARIRIVETSSEMALEVADDEVDSLSDVALRLQDDCEDTQNW
ncbi:regulator of G-protein signaling loco [Melitaea cinxia]|uniref:regulator of G-protein signaling loco n=1 Tax=Melitaea cinxia TaxID=113334 RepID=UPI001E270402|nr:regulator of G-protein signaling loco [Melitaea cinxia]